MQAQIVSDKIQIHCAICGQPIIYQGITLCNGCYEFDKHIDRILATDSGAMYVNQKILNHNAELMGRIMKRRIELEILGYEV